MTKTQKTKLKKTLLEGLISVILFTGLMSIGGCITTTTKVDPTPQERVAAEQAQVEELKAQSEYLNRIAIATEKLANNNVCDDVED